jgi:hypothetical protein
MSWGGWMGRTRVLRVVALLVVVGMGPSCLLSRTRRHRGRCPLRRRLRSNRPHRWWLMSPACEAFRPDLAQYIPSGKPNCKALVSNDFP